MVLKIIIFGIVMGIVPLLLGMLYTKHKEASVEDSLFLCYVKGMVTLLALLQILVIPMIFLHVSLTLLVYSYGGVIIALCVVSLAVNIRKTPKIFGVTIKCIKTAPWQAWLVVVLVFLQMYVLMRYLHIDEDDAFYVGAAVTAVDTDTIFSINPYTGIEYDILPSRYVLSPFPAFMAVIARIVQIHPTIVAHIGFPLIFIPLTYMVYTLLGRRFFRDNRKSIGYFLIFVSILQVFSAYSVYTPGIFLLTRIWQGKAILTAALLPAIFYFALEAFEKGSKKRTWILLCMLMFACCMVSSMGILLSALVLGIMALVCAIIKKNVKIILYSILCCLPNLLYAGIYVIIR